MDESGLPVAAVHTSAPEGSTRGQGFEIIGSVSSLYSQHYNSLTLEEGRVLRLNVGDPTALAPVIPRDLQKKQLSLWRFTQNPNYE